VSAFADTYTLVIASEAKQSSWVKKSFFCLTAANRPAAVKGMIYQGDLDQVECSPAGGLESFIPQFQLLGG